MVPLIPREVLFGNPQRISPRLSPDGRRIAWIAPDDGVLNVWVATVGEEDAHAVTSDRHRGIRVFSWAENAEQILYLQDTDGDENWHVFAVGAAGGEPRDLTPFDDVTARVLAAEPEFPDTILVALNDREPRLHDVHRIDTRTGERELVLRNELGAIDWTADRQLHVRVARVPTPDGGFRLLHREPEAEDWEPLAEWGPEDALSSGAIGFSADGRTLWLYDSLGANTAELRAMDVASGEEEVLASDPVYDASGVTVHPTEHRLEAVAFQRERLEWQVLDEAVRDDFEALPELHHGDLQIVARDHANRTWLVAFVQDRGPVAYYSWDRQAGEGTFLFSSRPELEEQPLAPMQPVSFEARDGLRIHGYLTLPPESDGGPLPAVINVHGGPWVRDTWGYDPEAQWLANRGYACLQVNYRGSTGYGKSFTNAANKQWGAKMQDDVSDARAWLIEEGIADPDRIAIYGGSYGGYAVLAGLTFTPDLYACGVELVGPSNLLTWMNTIPPYWEPFKPMLYDRVGHPERDEALLRSRSPLFHIDRIEAPLFIAQGKNDPRVPVTESLQIVEALEGAGKTVEYQEFADEGHGFARPENRLAFYAAAEKFLAEHLGGRREE